MPVTVTRNRIPCGSGIDPHLILEPEWLACQQPERHYDHDMFVAPRECRRCRIVFIGMLLAEPTIELTCHASTDAEQFGVNVGDHLSAIDIAQATIDSLPHDDPDRAHLARALEHAHAHAS